MFLWLALWFHVTNSKICIFLDSWGVHEKASWWSSGKTRLSSSFLRTWIWTKNTRLVIFFGMSKPNSAILLWWKQLLLVLDCFTLMVCSPEESTSITMFTRVWSKLPRISQMFIMTNEMQLSLNLCKLYVFTNMTIMGPEYVRSTWISAAIFQYFIGKTSLSTSALMTDIL